jgi:hypothetical protein
LRWALKLVTQLLQPLFTLVKLVGGAGNAFKILAVAIGLFAAMKLGTIVIGIVTALKALTLQAILAKAAVMGLTFGTGAAIAAAIAIITVLVKLIMKNWDKIKSAIKTGVEAINGFFVGLAKKIESVLLFLFKPVKLYFKLWKMVFKGILAGLNKIFGSKLFKTIFSIGSKIAGFFKDRNVTINENVRRNVVERGGRIAGTRAFTATGGGVSTSTDNSRSIQQANEINITTDNPQAAGVAVDQSLRRWTEQSALNQGTPVF